MPSQPLCDLGTFAQKKVFISGPPSTRTVASNLSRWIPRAKLFRTQLNFGTPTAPSQCQRLKIGLSTVSTLSLMRSWTPLPPLPYPSLMRYPISEMCLKRGTSWLLNQLGVPESLCPAVQGWSRDIPLPQHIASPRTNLTPRSPWAPPPPPISALRQRHPNVAPVTPRRITLADTPTPPRAAAPPPREGSLPPPRVAIEPAVPHAPALPLSYQVMGTWIYIVGFHRRVKVPSVRSILYSTT